MVVLELDFVFGIGSNLNLLGKIISFPIFYTLNMKIIHTFWTQNKNMNPLLNKGGWLTNEAHFMCWALSCLNAKKYYGSIELFTDEEGYDLFVNKLQLPYDKVNVIFDKKFFQITFFQLLSIITLSLSSANCSTLIFCN